MHRNPFSPSFSIHPHDFYGRKEYLSRFSLALSNPKSADRFFFLTGTRGCGKTSLLHQHALQAESMRWDVIEATGGNALDLLMHYAGLDSHVERASSLSPSISIGGLASASLGEVSRSVESSIAPSLLGSQLCKKLSHLRLKEGLLLVVDEAQKIAQDDIVSISNAVQQARTAGLGIGLILGGLPQTYPRIRSFKGCTFVRRMARQQLWCMTVSETMGFLEDMFARVPEIELSKQQIRRTGEFTGGHPYLMQLVGDQLYRLATQTRLAAAGVAMPVSDLLIDEAEAQSLRLYKENVLDDVLSGTHAGTQEYIRLAYELRDKHTGLTSVADINQHLKGGKGDHNSRRTYALATQVLRPAGRGYLRLALPHFEYVYRALEEPHDDQSLEDQWVY